jgi:hypothetical protein
MPTKDWQAGFIIGLSGRVTDELIADIYAGKLPEEWDGHELRRLLALRFERAIVGNPGLVRIKDFNNTIAVNNL